MYKKSGKHELLQRSWLVKAFYSLSSSEFSDNFRRYKSSPCPYYIWNQNVHILSSWFLILKTCLQIKKKTGPHSNLSFSFLSHSRCSPRCHWASLFFFSSSRSFSRNSVITLWRLLQGNIDELWILLLSHLQSSILWELFFWMTIISLWFYNWVFPRFDQQDIKFI